MPYSQSSQISTILTFLEKVGPISILDVGVGMGQYGFLARIHLEKMNLFAIDNEIITQRPKNEWKVQIDGIEACDIYITPAQRYAYNSIMIGDGIKILSTVTDNSYEVVLAIDILEHFRKRDGYKFLEQIKRITSIYALVSTPKKFFLQDIGGIPSEKHRSHWSKEQLLKMEFSDTLDNDQNFIAIYKKDHL